MIFAATNPTALRLTQLPECVQTNSEVWFGMLSGLLFGLLIYAVFDAAVYAFVLRKRRW